MFYLQSHSDKLKDRHGAVPNIYPNKRLSHVLQAHWTEKVFKTKMILCWGGEKYLASSERFMLPGWYIP